MIYQIIVSKSVAKFLQSHPDIQERFFEKQELMQYDPWDSRLDIKKMRGFDADYRMRIGKYRFLFTIQEQEVIIYFYDADSRGDVYK